jgi:two-component system, NarL family, sensor histidine kinase LiaS
MRWTRSNPQEAIHIRDQTSQADKIMKIFHQLRWKLTFSYTLVTLSAFLVVLLIMGGVALNQVFIPENFLRPEQLIEIFMNSEAPNLFGQVLSHSPVDMKLVNLLLTHPEGIITSTNLLNIGAIRLSVSTNASLELLVIGPDGILLGTSELGSIRFNSTVGVKFDIERISGLNGPFNAALEGETDPQRLYTTLEPNKKFVMATPIFNPASGEEHQVIGVIVLLLDSFPTQRDIPAHVLIIAGRSLLFFLLGTAIMGAVFGAFTANGLVKRFKRISTTADAWSEGNFSRYIDDSTGDEVAQFAQRLNNMAKQLQSLLHRRQEMAVSEERNRLARDLHDSAKQQALAASFELGTALTLYERDPGSAKKHLEEADTLLDSVRKELTNLVHELRLQSMDGRNFSETLKEYAIEWSHRSGIALNFKTEGNDELSLEIRETLFRIAQEALANIARHSSASAVDISLEYGTAAMRLVIKDNGHGFDLKAPHGGIGLDSMRERAEVSGGSFSIESALDQGTQIVVTVPKAIDEEAS